MRTSVGDENSCHSDDDKYCTDDDSEKKEAINGASMARPSTHENCCFGGWHAL